MSENLERYQCQIALPEFGKSSQELLKKAKILIVGMGGLGCPCSQYLASSGVGTIAIADDDMVSLSNLHRQILFTPEDVGKFKVDVAAKRLSEQNPEISIIPRRLRVTSENVMDLISEYDLIIEGTDNFETKYLLNDACVLAGKPLVYGAIYQYEGQVSIWNYLQKDGNFSTNYRDVFPVVESSQIPNCAEGGVIPTLAGMVGCMQANEAIKWITKSEDLLAGKLWMINMISGKTQVIKLKRTSIQITELPISVKTMSFEEFQKNMADFELIDVRSAQEHEDFNIGGKNIPLEKLDAELENFSNSNQIIFYCQTGKRSADAARKFQKKFPEKISYSLKDGVQGILK